MYINRKKSVNNRKTVKTAMTLTWYRHFFFNNTFASYSYCCVSQTLVGYGINCKKHVVWENSKYCTPLGRDVVEFREYKEGHQPCSYIAINTVIVIAGTLKNMKYTSIPLISNMHWGGFHA
jgi:hypothetical protein